MEQYTKHATGGYLQIPLCEKTVTTELTGDFTLPDYQPEIKRLLRISAAVLPPSKYVGSHEVDFEGSVDYYVLYTGSDNEIYCAPLSAEYKINMPYEGDEERELLNINATAAIVPDMISGRVTSPKKISIKCRLRTRGAVYGDVAVEDGFDKEDEDIEVLRGSNETTRLLWGTGDKLQVTDEMICDSREGEIRVICAEGNVLMSEVSAVTGGTACRGDLYLKLMISREDGTAPYTVIRKLPFSQTIAVDGAEPGCSATAKGTVSDMSITVEDGRVLMDIGLILESEVCKKESVGYVKDIYSTSRHTVCKYKKLQIPYPGTFYSGNFTFGDSVTIEEAGLAPGAKIIDAIGNAYPEEYNFEGDTCVVTGKAKFTLLTEKDEEYAINDTELPFRYAIKISEEMKEITCDAKMISVRARADGERLGIDAEIGVCAYIRGVSDMQMLDAVSFEGDYAKEKGEYVICYPSSEDTLWSVAKRYGTPMQILVNMNEISKDISPDSKSSLDGIKYLMI